MALLVVEPLLTWEPQRCVLGLPLGLAGFYDQREAFLRARELPPGVIWASFKSWWPYQFCLNLSESMFGRLSQVIVLGDMLSCTVPSQHPGNT